MEEKQRVDWSKVEPMPVSTSGLPQVVRLYNPFWRGILGGAIGMVAILVIAAFIYGGWTLYVHNQVLNQVVAVLNKVTTQYPLK